MPSSTPGRLHAILLIRNHSFFGRRTPAHGSGLRRSGPTSKRSGCPRPNRRHVFLQRQRQDADLSRIRLPLLQLQGLHGAFQIRGRGPQQRIQTLQTLFGPRGQIGFGSLQGCWGGVRIKADHVSPLPQTCQRGPSLQSLSCVSPCSQPFPAQLAVGYDISKRTQSGPPWPFLSPDRGNPRAHGAGLSPQRPVSLRKTVTESRHPSLGPSDPGGSGVPSFLSLQLFSDRSAS